MLATAEQVCHCPALAQDAVQDAWLAIGRNAVRFTPRATDPEAGAECWLLRHVFNAARNLLRSERRRQRRQLAASRPDAIEDSDHSLCALVQAGLERVAPTQREVLHLSYWQGCDHHQLASSLGCKPGTARQRLNRARAALRGALLPMMGLLLVTVAAFTLPQSPQLPSLNQTQRSHCFDGGFVDLERRAVVLDGATLPMQGCRNQPRPLPAFLRRQLERRRPNL